MLNIGTAYSNVTELYKYYQAVGYMFRVILTMNTIKQLILGAFTKLRKVTISFITSVCPHGISQLPLDRFSLYLISEHFSNNQYSSFITT